MCCAGAGGNNHQRNFEQAGCKSARDYSLLLIEGANCLFQETLSGFRGSACKQQLQIQLVIQGELLIG